MGENNDLAGISSTTLDLFQPDIGDDEALLLEGNLTSAGPGLGSDGISNSDKNSAAPFNTLDEPIRDTIWRDVRAVGLKFKHVLYPVEKTSLLKEWDLWGPLILCTFMATILQSHIDDDDHVHGEKGAGGDGGPEFAEVFVIVWAGSLVVTLNTKLLGGHISFFQSVCVLGYCLLPLGIALAICRYGNNNFRFILGFFQPNSRDVSCTYSYMMLLFQNCFNGWYSNYGSLHFAVCVGFDWICVGCLRRNTIFRRLSTTKEKGSSRLSNGTILFCDFVACSIA